jgi:hypothetical protein
MNYLWVACGMISAFICTSDLRDGGRLRPGSFHDWRDFSGIDCPGPHWTISSSPWQVFLFSALKLLTHQQHQNND